MTGRVSAARFLLRNRNYSALWGSETISALGDRVHHVALAALVYELTGSLTQTGLAFVAVSLPDLLLGLFAGVVVDRWNRRSVMIACDLLRVPFVLLIPLVAYSSLAGALVLLFLINAVSVAFRPAKNALIPSIVGPSQLTTANSFSSISENLSDLIGYPLAGVLIGAFTVWLGSDLGIFVAFVFDAATYIASALLLLLIRTEKREPALTKRPVRQIWPELREGISFVRSSPVLRANTYVMLLGPLMLGATTPLLVGYAYQVLEGGEWAYAMLGTGISAGSIVGGLWLSTESRFKTGWLVVSGLTLMGISVMATAAVNHLWIAMVTIAIGGVGSMMVLIPSVTLVHRQTPDYLLGRVFSFRSTLIFGIIILSNFAGGQAGDVFGVRETFFACGALLILASGISAISPAVRQVEQAPGSIASPQASD